MSIQAKQAKYQSRTLFIFLSSAMLILFAFMPLGNTLWAEGLTLGGLIQIGTWKTPPPNQAGTTLMAEKTAEGFAEETDGEIVYGVRGEICVTNGGERATEGLAITDVVQAKTGPGGFEDYYTEILDLGEKPNLAPQETYCYPYKITFGLPDNEKAGFRNTADVTITNHSGWLPGGNHCEGPEPCPFGPTPKTSFEIPEPPILATELIATQAVWTTAIETIKEEAFYGAEGEICVTNTGNYSTKGLRIQTTLQNKVKDAYEDKVSRTYSDIELASGETHCFGYDLSFPDPAETIKEPQLLTTLTINNHINWLGGSENCPELEICPFGPTLISSLEFPAPPPPPTDTPEPPAGTTLSVSKSAVGFIENGEADEFLYGVQGEICVKNEGELPTENLVLNDVVQIKTGTEEGAPFTNHFEIQLGTESKSVLESGETFCYPYKFTFDLPETEVVQFRNTVTATITNYFEWLPGGENCLGSDLCPYGPTTFTDFFFSFSSRILNNSSVT